MKISEKKTYLYILLALILCVSCAREAYNISYNGTIVDDETNCPLPYSTIQSFCLYQQNIDESGIHRLSTEADSLGRFQLDFDRGYKISLAIEADNYIASFVQFKPFSNHLPDTIFLKRKMEFQTSALIKAPIFP